MSWKIETKMARLGRTTMLFTVGGSQSIYAEEKRPWKHIQAPREGETCVHGQHKGLSLGVVFSNSILKTEES